MFSYYYCHKNVSKLAMKIQISEQTKDALKDARPRFVIQRRGEVDVKVI